MTTGAIRTDEERDFVASLGREVRRIKEFRDIPYSQVSSECGVSLGRISGLVSSYVLVKEEHEKVRKWVEKHSK